MNLASFELCPEERQDLGLQRWGRQALLGGWGAGKDVKVDMSDSQGPFQVPRV